MSRHYNQPEDGRSFFASATDADIDDGELLTLSFTTPATVPINLRVLAGITTAGVMSILEGTTVTAHTGSHLDCFNKDRNAPRAAAIKDRETTPASGVQANGTITGSGTTILTQRVAPGLEGKTSELRLKKSTTYTVTLTAVGDNQQANLGLEFWEGI
jgi:hypothetical protein